jgi:hypothetical protein
MSLTQQILDRASNPAELEETERAALLQACNKLTNALENPVEKCIRQLIVCCSALACLLSHYNSATSQIRQTDNNQSIYDPVALRVAVDLNLADISLAHGAPISVAELAEKSKADPELLSTYLQAPKSDIADT